MRRTGRSPSPRKLKKTISPSRSNDAPAQTDDHADVSKHLSERDALHISRKLFHSVGGVGIALLYHRYVARNVLIVVLGSFWLTLIFLETLRFRSKWIQAQSVKFMGSIMRRNELQQYSGMIYYIPGVIFCLYFFPPLIAKLAIIYLALGDPVAALVGTLFRHRLSHRRVHGKSLLGTLAAFITCLLITFVALHSMSQSLRIALALTGALAASVAELLVQTPRPAGVDDNFVIPVLSALALQAAVSFLAVQLPLVHPL